MSENRTVKELQEIARGLGLTIYVGKKAKTKGQLIEEIDSKTTQNETIETEEVEPTKPDGEHKPSQWYVDNMHEGRLVAFRKEKYGIYKMRTAMIKKICQKTRTVIVETLSHDFFTLDFEEIVWIKGNDRWPSFVMQELKGTKQPPENLGGK